MKISKVNHVRAGTEIRKEQGEGILYASPTRAENARKNLSEHIQGLNKRAMSLYSPLNPVKPLTEKLSRKTESDRDKKRDIESAAKAFRESVLSILKANSNGIPEAEILLNQIKKNAESCYTSLEDPKVLASKIAGTCLRKSLRKEEKVATELLAAILSVDKTNSINKLDKDEVHVFFELAHKDYYKSEQLKEIENSIVNKDVKVQVNCGEDGRKHLVLSSAGSKKKHFYFDFLKEYAARDKAGRDKMLIRFRQLIVLFYSGTEAYNLSLDSDVGAWTFGSSLPDISDNFNDTAATLISDYHQQQIEKESFRKKRDDTALKQKNFSFGTKEYKALEEERKKYDIAVISCQSAIKSLEKQIKQVLDQAICDNYRLAVKADGITEEDIFWIGYIQDVAKKQFEKSNAYTNYRISTKYLYETTFSTWLSFIALKYVDMGKAVYHFAMPNCDNIMLGEEIKAGVVQPLFEDGINSFDYERIKAKETITRSFATNATFATGVFSNAVADAEYRLHTEDRKRSFEDPLQYKKEDWEKAMKPDAKRNILMFFGGQSQWKESEIDGKSNMEMTLAFQNMINIIRNSNFHYAGCVVKPYENSISIMQSLFSREYQNLGRILRGKYLSNNVPVYYRVSDIDTLMSFLYQGEHEMEAQIPSFGNILKRKELPDYIQKKIPSNRLARFDVKELEKFRSSLYFVLKEIYYYGFLQEKDLKERFVRALNNEKNVKNPEALLSFKMRLKDLAQDASFGEVCQTILTDYNQQNQGEYRIKSQISQKKDQDQKKGHKYEHFKMLLYVAIRGAFIQYLEEMDIYSFLFAPEFYPDFHNTDAAKEFPTSWNADFLGDVKGIILNDTYCLSWYALSHFLSPKQLNHLQGDVKSYLQFVFEINRREKSVVGKERDTRLVDCAEDYRKILKVLEFVMSFVGKTSNELTDYFTDADAYARHISAFVSYAGKKEEKNNVTLSAFCDKSIEFKKEKIADRIGIYHDGTNPIMNQNVVKALMYGNEKILSEAVSKVSADLIHGDILHYYLLQRELSDVLKNGTCKNREEQEKLREFQNVKNKVELYNISLYSDIINDYMGELVNMAYFRERDLMYFQLGYHYLRQEYTDVESRYRMLEGKDIRISDGALLYQICALYTYHLPLITKGKSGEYEYTMDDKIRDFVKNYCEESMQDNDNVYCHGLELFEQLDRHEKFHQLRNEIDHLKYMICPKKSLLDMYSRIYNGFFNYDIKLKKSVSYIFTNIMAKYFVLLDTSIKVKTEEGHRIAVLSVAGVSSDYFHYEETVEDKRGGRKKRKYALPVRNKDFLKDVKSLLEYKKSIDITKEGDIC